MISGKKRMNKTEVIIDGQDLCIEDICAVAEQVRTVKLSEQVDFVKRIDKGAAFIDTLLEEEGCVYGVTTGYGDSCTVSVPLQYVAELPKHLYTFHGCGLGKYFDPQQTRAILLVRLNSLAQGFSGVRYLLLQQITVLLNKDILPLIPEEGSVGASGDLTPLSYLAAVLAGEREVLYQGQKQQTKDVFAQLNITPLRLKPKEGLALMNGTAVMTAVACIAYQRAAYLSQMCTRITSMASLALKGNVYHFDEKLFSVKPHHGQIKVAQRIRTDLHLSAESPRNDSRL